MEILTAELIMNVIPPLAGLTVLVIQKMVEYFTTPKENPILYPVDYSIFYSNQGRDSMKLIIERMAKTMEEDTKKFEALMAQNRAKDNELRLEHERRRQQYDQEMLEARKKHQQEMEDRRKKMAQAKEDQRLEYQKEIERLKESNLKYERERKAREREREEKDRAVQLELKKMKEQQEVEFVKYFEQGLKQRVEQDLLKKGLEEKQKQIEMVSKEEHVKLRQEIEAIRKLNESETKKAEQQQQELDRTFNKLYEEQQATFKEMSNLLHVNHEQNTKEINHFGSKVAQLRSESQQIGQNIKVVQNSMNSYSKQSKNSSASLTSEQAKKWAEYAEKYKDLSPQDIMAVAGDLEGQVLTEPVFEGFKEFVQKLSAQEPFGTDGCQEFQLAKDCNRGCLIKGALKLLRRKNDDKEFTCHTHKAKYIVGIVVASHKSVRSVQPLK